jgi:hypothetical protein
MFITTTKINQNIPYRTYELLWINLDEHLTLNTHFSILPELCTYFARVKNFLPKTALEMLFKSLFHCHLLYCPIFLNISSPSKINQIALLQPKAIRIIIHSNYIQPILTPCLWIWDLPFEKLIKLNKALFMHSIAFNYANDSFIHLAN